MKAVKLWRAANPQRLATLLLAVWKLFQHPRTPRSAKLVAIVVLAYAVSPIDLIPDFIPVLGLLDDLVLVPLGITLAMKLAPPEVWQQCLAEAEASREQLPRLMWGAGLIVVFWLAVLALLLWWIAS